MNCVQYIGWLVELKISQEHHHLWSKMVKAWFPRDNHFNQAIEWIEIGHENAPIPSHYIQWLNAFPVLGSNHPQNKTKKQV